MESKKERAARIEQEQRDMSREEILGLMDERSEFVVDLDNIKPQKHLWVDRGAKLSCEGASHPHHQAWKRRR